jgi:hypothetical protein
MASKEVNLPDYVDYGGRLTAPGDFLCLDGHFRSIFLEGDKQAITSLVDKVFNQPARGAARFQVLTKYVLLQIGWFGQVRATTEPHDQKGFVREEQASLWVPLVQGHEEDGRFVRDRLVLAVPFIFVDNPMSYVGGRETYGFPKSLGRFDFERGVDGTMTCSTYGGDFAWDNQADWRPLMKLTVTEPAVPGRETELDGNDAILEYIAKLEKEQRGESLSIGDLRLLRDILEQVFGGLARQVFLKQFRDAHDPDGACYQEIIEANIEMGKTKTRLGGGGMWQVDVTDFQSHPIGADLGVRSQRTRLSYAVDMEFTCKRGSRVTREPLVPAATT